MGAGADEDLGARLPDWAATGPAQSESSAKTATTLKCETRRWFVMVVIQDLKLETL